MIPISTEHSEPWNAFAISLIIVYLYSYLLKNISNFIFVEGIFNNLIFMNGLDGGFC